MKKLFLLSIAIIAIMFTNCQKDDVNPEVTGTLKMNAIVEKTSSLTKSAIVERGDIPVYVDCINTKVTDGTTSIENVFQLVDNGTEGSSSEFIINKIPLSYDSIFATSGSKVDGEHNIILGLFEGDETISNLEFAESVGHSGGVPYIIYTGKAGFEMSYSNLNSEVSVPMTTKYGRDMGVIINHSDWNLEITIDSKTLNGQNLYNEIMFGDKDVYESITLQIAPGQKAFYYISNKGWCSEYTDGTPGAPVYTGEGAGVNVSIRYLDSNGNDVCTPYDRHDQWFNVAAVGGVSCKTLWNIYNTRVDKEALNSMFQFIVIDEHSESFDL